MSVLCLAQKVFNPEGENLLLEKDKLLKTAEETIKEKQEQIEKLQLLSNSIQSDKKKEEIEKINQLQQLCTQKDDQIQNI